VQYRGERLHWGRESVSAFFLLSRPCFEIPLPLWLLDLRVDLRLSCMQSFALFFYKWSNNGALSEYFLFARAIFSIGLRRGFVMEPLEMSILGSNY